VSVKALTDTAIKHLYAGELLRKVAVDITGLMEHMTDEQVLVAVRIRQLVLGYAESELVVTTGLCDIARAEQEAQA